MYAKDAVDHLENYPVETLDGRTREILHEVLTDWLTQHNRITQTVAEQWRPEFRRTFQEDVDTVIAALAVLDAEKRQVGF